MSINILEINNATFAASKKNKVLDFNLTIKNEGDIISEPAEKFDSDEKEETKSNYSLNVKNKTTKVDEFDKMFDGEDDDLPF